MFRAFYITTHLKVPSNPLRSTAAVFPSRSSGASLWKHDWPRSRRGPGRFVCCGKRPLELGCPHVGGKAPFPSKHGFNEGFFGIHYLTCNDHGKGCCFWDGGRLELWDNARLSWWNGTVLPVLGWNTHYGCRWWKKNQRAILVDSELIFFTNSHI